MNKLLFGITVGALLGAVAYKKIEDSNPRKSAGIGAGKAQRQMKVSRRRTADRLLTACASAPKSATAAVGRT